MNGYVETGIFAAPLDETIHPVPYARSELSQSLINDEWIEWDGVYYDIHPTSGRFAIGVDISATGVTIKFAPGEDFVVSFPPLCPNAVILAAAQALRHEVAQ